MILNIVFPASVGMNRFRMLEVEHESCVPRERGDEPAM